MTAPPAPAPDCVLVVDDEPDLCRLLVYNLQQGGFTAESAGTGADGLAAAARLRPAIVVLDLMLPDLPGTEICRRLRADPVLHDVGILMLTARGDEHDRVVGFELGTDDYVVKPFSPRELVLRVRALARRCSERRAARAAAEAHEAAAAAAPSAPSPPQARRLCWRELELDATAHRVHARGVELALRPMEFKLVQLFLEHPAEVYSRERLLEEVWGSTDDVNPRTVDTHVRRLRERLGAHGDVIETVHGFGYRLREP